MKNLFLSLAFMLVGSFAFANTSNNTIDLNKIESLINVDIVVNADNFDLKPEVVEVVSCGFTVTYDDGSDGDGEWGGSGTFFQAADCDNPFNIFGWLNSTFPGWNSAIIRFR